MGWPRELRDLKRRHQTYYGKHGAGVRASPALSVRPSIDRPGARPKLRRHCLRDPYGRVGEPKGIAKAASDASTWLIRRSEWPYIRFCDKRLNEQEDARSWS